MVLPTSANDTYTHPDVFTIGVEQRWADPEIDPTRIDWTARRADALIPYPLVDGRPVNPYAPTGIRYGRNQLGRWGESRTADALVLLTDQKDRWRVLMVERTDGHGWALPGGWINDGEDAVAAAQRELEEETGLVLPLANWRPSPPRYVPDPRASDEAWIVTVVAETDLGHCATLPAVTGSDDAARAAWVRADSYPVLLDDLADRFDGHLFEAHRELIIDALR